MKHVIAVALLSSFTAACGSSISSGASVESPDIPAPELRTPGAPSVAVDEITPASGSSKTRWTLRGTGLSGVENVWFGDSLATLESVSDTEVVVTNAFGTREAMGILEVTFEIAGERHSAPSVTGYPDGTVRESGNESRTWFRTSSMAANASTIFVADSTRGVYALDRATDAVTVIAKNGSSGIETATAVFVAPSGDLFVTDETAEGNRRLLHRVNGAFLPFAVLAEPALDVAFSNGMVFAVGSSSVRKFLDDGTEVLSFQPSIPDEIGGGFAQNGTLYVTQRWNGTILAVDPTWGVVTDLAIGGLSTPGAISGDGSLLYVADDNGIETVDADGNVVTVAAGYTPFASYGSIDSLVVSGASVLASEALGTSVMDLGAGSVRIAAAGIGPTFAMAQAGDALVLSSYETCFDASGTGAELPAGVVYALTAGGARIVSRDVCPISGLGASGSGAVLYTNASFDGTRVEVGRLDLATGSHHALATEADGLLYPMTAVEDASGNVYVAEADFSTGSGFVSRITADGTFESAWAQGPSSFSWSLAVSGTELFLTDVNVMGLWTVPLATGGAAASLDGAQSVFPTADGIVVTDDGVLVSDLVSGAIQRVGSDGTVAQAAPGLGAIELDTVTGDLRIVEAAAEGVRLTAIMP